MLLEQLFRVDGTSLIVPNSDPIRALPPPRNISIVCSNGQMRVIETSLPGVLLLEPRVFSDDRGWFAEVFNESTFRAAGLPDSFVQDNQSFSKRGVLRGLHYQLGKPQGKLVRALSGHIFDVAVDLRRDSPHFGKWAGFDLTGGKLQFLWIPEGFAHGFLVLSETATVLYKTTNLYHPAGERCIRWDDPTINIAWPQVPCSADGDASSLAPLVSGKDAEGALFKDAELPPVG